MFHSSRSESCGTEGGGSIIYPATGACYLHHGDNAGEIALETERRLSSSSCSGAASGWSRRPRGTMAKWTNGASVSFPLIDHGSAKGGLPSSEVQTTSRKAKVHAWLCARSLPGCEKWPCIFRYESGRTSVNHCRMMRQHLSRKVSGSTASQPQTRRAAAWRLLYLFNFFILLIWF